MFIIMRWHHIFLLPLIGLLIACPKTDNNSPGKLSIGVVSYGDSERSLERYSGLKKYLGSELKSIVEFEPAFNEVQALEQIKRRRWDLVFAPPGLAAIAIAQNNYVALFPLEGLQKTRSVIVVREDSEMVQLQDLAGKVIALGQPGSATGYYLPIYNLYGLTLAEVRFAPTPKTILAWLDSEEVTAGALSLDEFNRHRTSFPSTKFRILDSDSHNVPTGAVLVGENIERNQQEMIRDKLSQVPPSIAAAAGYIPNDRLPDYKYLIDVVERVTPIAERIKEKPAPLYEQKP